MSLPSFKTGMADQSFFIKAVLIQPTEEAVRIQFI
jgi:hypothetical protein